jgi:nitroimidazol reductase NimA-like FMN-containing flavoprotein (pyridoxamine 5'-phosphate oxidase superfamily)
MVKSGERSARSLIPATTSRGTVSVLARLKRFDRTQRHAVLATTLNERPHASLVAFAITPDGRGLLFATPRGTTKYRNMIENNRVSLVVDNRENDGTDYLDAEAFTIFGRAREVHKKLERTALAGVLAGKHPVLREFIDAPTTALILVRIERCLHIGRFQTVTPWKA